MKKIRNTEKEKKKKEEKEPRVAIGIKWKSLARLIPWRLAAKPILRGLGRFIKAYMLPACCFLLCIGMLLFGGMCAVSAAVCDRTEDRILDARALGQQGEKFDCILVLGCRVYSDGRLSHMLQDRVATAVSLYQSGAADTILMSGDSQSPAEYDETGAMKRAAADAGVPEEAILIDPMGLSTYDSIARFLEDHKGERVLIVTQRYHLYRALYIAEKLGVEACGVSADLRSYAGQIKYDMREILARCKDVYYALKKPAPAQASWEAN